MVLTNSAGVVLDPATLPPHVRQLSEQVEHGDPEAQYMLARLFFRGEGVPQDSPKAAQLYHQAAQGGYQLDGPPEKVAAQINARYMLGTLYSLGDGLPQEKTTGEALWKQAEELERACSARKGN